MTRDRPIPGNFYAVGVGPGSPDLLTYRAASIVRDADVIVAPRSRMADESLALKTVQHLLRPEQEVVDHVYAMKRDIDKTRSNWNQIVSRFCSPPTRRERIFPSTNMGPKTSVWSPRAA